MQHDGTPDLLISPEQCPKSPLFELSIHELVQPQALDFWRKLLWFYNELQSYSEEGRFERASSLNEKHHLVSLESFINEDKQINIPRCWIWPKVKPCPSLEAIPGDPRLPQTSQKASRSREAIGQDLEELTTSLGATPQTHEAGQWVFIHKQTTPQAGRLDTNGEPCQPRAVLCCNSKRISYFAVQPLAKLRECFVDPGMWRTLCPTGLSSWAVQYLRHRGPFS